MNLSDNNNSTEMSRHREFVNLLTANHYRIYNYILKMIPNYNDANDIMQETSVVMLEKFDSFKSGTNFVFWATTIAKFKVFEFIKSKKDRVVFNQDIVEELADECGNQIERDAIWLGALRECVLKLQKSDRSLIVMHYYNKTSIKEIGKKLGCSFQKIYRNMSHINALLVRCVRKKVDYQER